MRPSQKQKREKRPKAITVVSFGFKHGRPPKASLKADVRFVPNPYWVAALREKTGRHPEVRKYLLARASVRSVIEHLAATAMARMEKRKGRGVFVLAIGCTGGRHRSVVISESVAGNLKKLGVRVRIVHRDIQKK